MPILTLTTSIAITESKQEKIAKSLTTLTSQCLHKNKDVTMVNIVPDHGLWFGANGLVTDAVYQLSIFITAGTNTEKDIVSWLDETWQYLRKELDIADDSVCYTSVLNNDVTNWGFNGINQSTRNKT